MTGRWTHSPDPAVEAVLSGLEKKYPPIYSRGVERTAALLEKLNNPHLNLPPVFHVAGTNGKGSTLAFLQAMFEAGGLSVHKYTSPHLVRFEERIVLNGKMIGRDKLLELLETCTRAAEGLQVSFFEFCTALAFLAAAGEGADAFLLETGLGGTDDATNLVPQTTGIITRISFDHMNVLGNTLNEIAANKAGIMRKACACVIAPQKDAEVLKVFEDHAARTGAKLFRAGHEWCISSPSPALAGEGRGEGVVPQKPQMGIAERHPLPQVRERGPEGFMYESNAFKFNLPTPALTGAHQIENAATAIAALEQSAFSSLLKQDILTAAMRNVRWPGRMQRLVSGPAIRALPGGWELWLDGAHNDSGAETLVRQARDWGAEKPLHLVTAMKEDKDAEAFFRPLAPYLRSATAVAEDVGAPMMKPQELCDHIRRTGLADVTCAETLESAIEALVFQYKTPRRILVTGSLYLAGHVLRSHR